MYAASAVGSAAGSVYSRRFKLGSNALSLARNNNGDELDASRRPSFENAVFGVLFTLSKENSETRIVMRWVFLKTVLDGWQIFTTVIQPSQGWDIDSNGMAWKIVNVLSFNWLADLGYGAYVGVLYGMVALLGVNIGLCVWVAWCFKEQKFPVVWPIQVLRICTSVFFQAFDIASLNLLQVGITCQFDGPDEPHMHLYLFPQYSCAAMPQVVHAVVSAVSLLVFILLALLTNMAEVEVNPKSRRPMALGHSGAEVMVFAIKVVMTLTSVFFGWKKVSSTIYLALSLVIAWQYLRWSPNLVNWVNYLKSGLSVSTVWCAIILMFLVFRPGVKDEDVDTHSKNMTRLMLGGIGPSICVGAALSWWLLRRAWKSATKAIALAAEKKVPLEDMVVDLWTDPRDVEIAARCCRVWVDRNILDKEAVAKSQTFTKAGLNVFPGNAFVSLVQANFMIDVLGVSQSGSRQIEAARKLAPGIMSRFIIFVRMQQAQQKAAGTSAGAATVDHNMDLLGYVEYQRKQRMVVRLHREALTAMCAFWKALDSHTVSFTYLSKALANIEVSVSRAQTAYHLVLESYSNNYRLVRLYGKFLETVKNDPWGALEYFSEADRLEQEKNDDGNGPLLPDGTPLSRMDELATAVVVISASGEVQMANKQVHHLFGFKKGDLDGKPITMLLAPQSNKRITKCLAMLVEQSMQGLGQTGMSEGAQGDHTASTCTSVLGMHHERMAFPLRISLTKASGVGEDSTFIALLEPVHAAKDVSYFWVAANGVIAGIDPQYVANFGYMPHDVIGSHLGDFLVVDGDLTALRAKAEAGRAGTNAAAIHRWDVEAASIDMSQPIGESVTLLHSIVDKTTAGEDAPCHVSHRYSPPSACVAAARLLELGDAAVYEVKICRASSEPYLFMVTDKKGAIQFTSPQLTTMLCPRGSNAPGGQLNDGDAFKDRTDSGHKGVAHHGLAILSGVGAAHGLISGYNLGDFLPHPWKDTHVKLLKDSSSTSTLSKNPWSCTRQAAKGPTVEMQDAHGQKMYMHISASSAELVGEHLHIIKLSPSSVDTAVSERRLRLTVSSEGLITEISKDTPSQHLFGFDASHLIGQALWDVVDGVEQQLLNRPASSMGRVSGPGKGNASAFSTILERAIHAPGRSWRISVIPPGPISGSGTSGTPTNAELAAAQRAAHVRAAMMQLHIPVLEAEDDGDGNPTASEEASAAGGKASGEPPALLVDLWPNHSVSGVLELNAMGRVTTVQEEHARPAGLLFGLATKSLIGQALTALLMLPPGREEMGDLLSANARSKKSSLKTTQKDPAVKVGPVHVLQAVHSDGKPLKLSVQVVGKPGPGQPLTVLLRVQAAPTSPNGGAVRPDGPLQLPPPAPAIPPAKTHTTTTMKPTTKAAALAAATTAAASTAAPAPVVTSGDEEDSTPSLQEMEDIVAGRSYNGRSVRGKDKDTDRAGTGTGMTAGGSLRRSFMSRTEKEGDKDKPPSRGGLEKSSTAKFATGTGLVSQLGARPVTPSTPVKAPAELLSAHVNGSGSQSHSNEPETLTLPPPETSADGTGAGAAAAGSAAPPMPAALKALGLGMDLPLPGVVMGVGGHLGSARRNSVSIKEPAQIRAGPDSPGALSPTPPNRIESSIGDDKSGSGDGDGDGGGDADGDAEDSDVEGSAGVSKDSGSSKEDASGKGSKGDGGGKGMGGDGGGGDDEVQAINPKNLARIKEWVVSKGEVYQNSKPKIPSADYSAVLEEQVTTGDDADDTGATSESTTKEKAALAAKAKGLAGRTLGSFKAAGGLGSGGMGSAGPRSGKSLWGVASRVGSVTSDVKGGAPGAEGGGGGGGGGGRRLSNTGMGLPPGLAPPVQQGLIDFDDAASNGGRSEMSGNSGTSSGAEYKRGKRFRNLVKLMDSSEAEQVLRRFRRGALLTMAILAVAHTACFAAVVISIKGQQVAMSQLVTTGRSSRYMHQVLVSVRALDQIYKGKIHENLYTTADIPTFADNIINYASQVKDLNNYVADHNWNKKSIRDLFYFSYVQSWYANNATTGEDLFKDITLWDVNTKLYISSKDIYQNYANWSAEGVNISSTYAGQFLFKTAPDLFVGYRKLLDALLYSAMDNTTTVNNLLLAFLVTEGCGVSVLAAALLAYLLRKLAVQRYTLYGTFLAIPVGLTRALTSQLANTTLLEEEDDDDSDDDGRDEEDNNDKGHAHGSVDGVEQHKHRHATLEAAPPAQAGPPSRPRPSFLDTVAAAAIASSAQGGGKAGMDSGVGPGRAGPGGQPLRWRSSSLKGRIVYRLSKCFPCLARRSQTVFPTPTPGESLVHGHHRRMLRMDSNDTTRLLMPFVLWSCLVIIFYSVSVVELKQSSPLVAIASVSNYNTARTYRTCFYAQELAAEEDPNNLPLRIASLEGSIKQLRDVFYTLQLGKDAWRTLGNDTEIFPLVTDGLSYETPGLQRLFYANTGCLRQSPNLPCPGTDYRYYQVTHAGVDSIMQIYLDHLYALVAETTNVTLGLASSHFDFIYNVGTKDLTDANIQIGELHFKYIKQLFSSILLLHILLFVLLWFFLAGFYGLLLKPLNARLAREKRHIAELMSQLPMELDVEKLVRLALSGSSGATSAGHGATDMAAGAAAAAGQAGAQAGGAQVVSDAAKAWKNVLRSTIKDANQVRVANRERRASMMSVNTSMAYG